MKRLCHFILVFLFVLVFLPKGKAQNISNEGTEFWTVFPTHVPNPNSPAIMNVNITSRYNTEVTVSCGNTSETKSILANTVVTFLVNRPQSYIEVYDGNRNLVNRGIHIKVTDGMPKVIAYSHVFASARSAATLILPVEALGNKYYSMNYSQDNTGQNFLAVVAVEDNTDLVLHKNDGTDVFINGLNKGDVYQHILPNEDFTGTYIETAANSSCKRFATFSGSSAVRIGGSTGGIDPLLQQLYPINSWGKTYGIVPFIGRRYIVRALAQEDNTNINFDGVPAGVVNKGKYIEKVLTEPTIVSSDKVISVAQYAYTQEFSSPTGGGLPIGDPEMVLLNPIEFNIKNITLFSSDRNNIAEKYLNVFMKTDKSSSFKINGAVPLNVVWNTMPSDPTYSYAQIQVFDNSLTLSANDGFNAITYGMGDHESYAYSAGTNLASNQFLTLINNVTNVESSSACIDQRSDFKISLPYKLDKIIWKFDDGEPDIPINNPIFTTSGTNPIIYTYSAPVSKVFSTVSRRQVIAIATATSVANSCFSGDMELVFDFDVDPLPTAKIAVAAVGCSGNEISFKDESVTNVLGKSITKWQWDFGDGTTVSTEENPKHIFVNPGTYTVKLMVGSEGGCLSEVVTQEITINPKPIAKFTVASDFCVERELTINNLSSIEPGASIKSYIWDFGDGTTPISTTDASPPIFKYATLGTKTIKLTVVSDLDCISEVASQTVNIVALPIVDFQLPGYCINDGLAKFPNLTKDHDGTTANLRFEWNFGDAPAATVQSTGFDGEHIYATAGVYTVTLKAYNQFGCLADVKTQQFIANPFVETADFDIQNASNLCSGNDVIINNKSTIAPQGKILKIEVYKDFLGDPTNFITIDNPQSEDIILSYPKFGGMVNRSYSIRLVAYSGETCKEEITKIIEIKPSPILAFEAIPEICVNQGIFSINQARETSGLTGNGVYSGNGIISVDGKFDPRITGVGTFPITYTYTSNISGSCQQIITQNITVKPSPTVSLPTVVYVLIGGQVEIPALAEGTNMTYKWSPALGLNRDDILNPIASPQEDTEYTITATNDLFCSTTAKVTVKVLENITIPNSFSPNGDNVNDFWNIKYLETYPNATVEVFSRNGTRVFLSKGYTNPFDGNYQSQQLPVGVYYYIVDPKNGRKRLTGSLTIIR